MTYINTYIINRNEPQHEISNVVVCAISKGSDQPGHTHSLIRAFASRFARPFKLLTDYPLEVQSFKEGCTSSSESLLVEIPHC